MDYYYCQPITYFTNYLENKNQVGTDFKKVNKNRWRIFTDIGRINFEKCLL